MANLGNNNRDLDKHRHTFALNLTSYSMKQKFVSSLTEVRQPARGSMYLPVQNPKFK